MRHHQRPRVTDAEREARRAEDRERVTRAAQELLTSDGWARWVRARGMFHSYSVSNCMLLALQFNERGIDPERVAGFQTWLKLGRCVRRGETSIKVLAPVTIRTRTRNDTAAGAAAQQSEARGQGRRLVAFRAASVFSLSQTDPLPGVEQLPLAPPCEPLSGDTHGHLIDPLTRFAQGLGYTVSFQEIPGSTGGWCDATNKQIVVDTSQSINGQVRTLVHETVHALGIDYTTYTRAQAEVIVDTTTLVVLAAAGLDTSGETIPYVAGWGETGALQAVSAFAAVIDQHARTIEKAIIPDRTNPDNEGEGEREGEGEGEGSDRFEGAIA